MEVIDEKDPIEVIQLVLETHGEHAVARELVRIAVAIERAKRDPFGPRDPGIDVGYGQAAFTHGSAPAAFKNDRIYQNVRLVAGGCYVGHDNSPVKVDLRGRQADTVSRVHDFDHLADQPADLGINLHHGCGDGPQAGIWILQDAAKAVH
jgi:hypothetical protein